MNQESEENKEQVDRDLSGLVRQVARRYARRCWWAEEAELAQVAWTAALQARALFEPEKAPNGIKPFARLRVERTVSRFLLANSSPVSASDHARYDLIGIQRESLAIMRLGTAAHDNPADWKRDRPELTDHRTPEQALVEERWRARVRARVVALAGSHAADLLDARRPAGSAERAQAYAALRALHEDEELRALWRSR